MFFAAVPIKTTVKIVSIDMSCLLISDEELNEGLQVF